MRCLQEVLEIEDSRETWKTEQQDSGSTFVLQSWICPVSSGLLSSPLEKTPRRIQLKRQSSMGIAAESGTFWSGGRYRNQCYIAQMQCGGQSGGAKVLSV